MADDNNFTLGDILWEYADYTPPEPPPTTTVPLPPEKPLPPPVSPPPSPVPPIPPPAPPPVTPPPPPPAQPETPPLADEAPPLADETPPPAGETPLTEPTASQSSEEAPAPAATGLADDDGPDLIAFTPDPVAQAAAQAAQESAAQEPAAQPENSAEGAPPQTPPPQQPPPPPAAQPTAPRQAAAQSGPTDHKTFSFSSRRERKSRPAPEVPPDAAPAQLAAEYSEGLNTKRNKCISAALVTCVLLVLSLVESGLLPLFRGDVPTGILLPVGLALFLVVGMLCLDVLKAGLIQLTNKAPDQDTLALLSAVFTLADGFTQMVFQFRPDGLPFFAPCGLVLTCHLMGQYLTQSTRHQTCRTASSVARPYVVTRDENVLNNQPAFRKWFGVPKGFGSQVRTLSEGEFRFQRLTPVLLTACFVLALLTTVLHRQADLALWSLSALFCAASTLGASMTLSLPQRMVGKRLSKEGVALAGWPGLVSEKGCRGAVLLDYDIYPPGSISLVNAQPFGSWSLERVASYAASVIRSSGSGLAYPFDQILKSQRGAYVTVEKLIVQDGGFIGHCQGQDILVGSGDFMSRQAIALPQGVKARDAVFCAVGREIAGMFVLRYTMHEGILPSLNALFAHKMHPILATRDFTLTPQRLRLRGRLPVDQVSFPDLARRISLSGHTQNHGSTILAVICREGLPAFADGILAAKRLRRAASLNSYFVCISACVGVFLTASLSSAAALGAMCAWNLSLYLLLWLAPVALLALWTNQF